MRKSDFCLNKHKIRAVCKQVLSAETFPAETALKFCICSFVLLEEILQNQIYKHMAKVWSAFEAQFCRKCHFPVAMGTVILMVASLLKVGNLGERVNVASLPAPNGNVGAVSKGRKTGIQGKRNPGTKWKFSNKRNYSSQRLSLVSPALKLWLKVKFTPLSLNVEFLNPHSAIIRQNVENKTFLFRLE